jgi:hypothetical protein
MPRSLISGGSTRAGFVAIAVDGRVDFRVGFLCMNPACGITP